MSSAKLEYDSSLGGAVQLSNHVMTYRHAADNLQELRQLLQEVRQPRSGTKLIFQQLPKHMRRRAMSHFPKRLPCKYRSAHIAQMAKSGKVQQRKQRSRKCRRRPSNLLRHLQRRQRRNIWLETHIWHAKRFHMIERWNYRLAYASCDKTYRASYRASAQHCLLQDISYWACFELQGSLMQLQQGFNRLTSSECGLSIVAQTYVTGRREGSVELFRAEQYPAQALARVHFMWRATTAAADEETVRTLWLFVHPRASPAVLQQLLLVFELQSKRQQSYENATTQLQLRVLSNQLNRFRLTGALSQAVLYNAFKVKSLQQNASDLSAEQLSSHALQQQFWQHCSQLSSPTQLLSNLIVALNIEDPRLQRPQRRSKAINKTVLSNEQLPDMLLQPPNELSQSVLWQQQQRERVCAQMLSTHAYNQLRQRHAIVPGAPCEFEQQLQSVPVLLIQRPGSQQANKRLGYACGWDVIVPPGYGMCVWLSLIMWGAKPGGLRESETVARELGTEQQLPDTCAAKQEALETAAQLRHKYFQRPPNKRCNYRKLSIVSPFKAPLWQLVRDWQSTPAAAQAKQFYVLRNRAQLQQLQHCIKRMQTQLPSELCQQNKALVQLQLRMQTRGSPNQLMLICVPTKRDLKRNLRNRCKAQHQPIYCEPLLPDLQQTQRKLLRKMHKKQLKRLRAQRVREKRKLQQTSTKRVFIRPAGNENLNANYNLQMRQLWLPDEECETLFSVRKQCTREVCGYVTSASFSFLAATVCAVGYVTIAGLQELLQICQKSSYCGKRQPLCLLRSINSRNYHFATFSVNLNV